MDNEVAIKTSIVSKAAYVKPTVKVVAIRVEGGYTLSRPELDFLPFFNSQNSGDDFWGGTNDGSAGAGSYSGSSTDWDGGSSNRDASSGSYSGDFEWTW